MTTCAHPDGCPRPAAAGGWCNAHYLRWSKAGDVGPAAIKRVRPDGAVCALDGCDLPRMKRDWCNTHYMRWKTHGDASITHVRRGNPTYLSLHKQLYRRKGKAAEHVCAHCGGQARQWAYDHRDPDERIGTQIVRGEPVELTYSEDPAHYIPLCVPCHVRFDAVVAA